MSTATPNRSEAFSEKIQVVVRTRVSSKAEPGHLQLAPAAGTVALLRDGASSQFKFSHVLPSTASQVCGRCMQCAVGASARTLGPVVVCTKKKGTL